VKNLLIKIINKIKTARPANERGSDEPPVNVPDTVIANFWSKYPQAKLKKWRCEHDTYIAAFVSRNHRYEACYNAAGDWVKSEMRIPVTRELPPAISRSLKASEFAAWKITEVKKIELHDQSLYVIRVENSKPGNSTYKLQMANLLYIKPDGSLLKIDEHTH
jgi:hypothetical protein